MPAEMTGWLVAVLTVLGMAGLAWRVDRRYGPLRDQEVAQEKEVADLLATVNTLRRQLDEADRRIKALEQEAAERDRQLAETCAELRALRTLVSKSRRDKSPGRPLLIIQGDDPDIATMDEEQVSAIGVRYTRLKDADEGAVADELQRVREDNRLYPWVLISAHAGPAGVRLRQKMVSNDFWMRQLVGVSVVALAACEGTNLADHLRDKVDFVWYFKEGVPSTSAARFMARFFQRLNSGDDPHAAFTSACDTVPSVAPYADYRSP